MTSDQIGAIRSTIGGFLTDPCAKFIDRLISAQTGKPYDSKTQLLTDFNKVKDGVRRQLDFPLNDN
jgi:1,6-anhydro-N-acetylmuramate kinase